MTHTPPTPADLTQSVIHLLDYAGDQPGTEYEDLARVLVEIGLLRDCEDCLAHWLYPDDGPEVSCYNCGHVQGDPFTGSTPDDRPMRVCEPCQRNEHHHCDGGDPHDLEATYCNCKRIGHPAVTIKTGD